MLIRKVTLNVVKLYWFYFSINGNAGKLVLNPNLETLSVYHKCRIQDCAEIFPLTIEFDFVVSHLLIHILISSILIANYSIPQ